MEHILQDEEIRPRGDEADLLRYDSAARRLLSSLPAGDFSREDLYRDTGVRFTGDRFLLAKFEDDPGHPPCPPPDADRTTPGQRYVALRDGILAVITAEHPAVLCNQGGCLLCVINWQGPAVNWQGSFAALVERVNRMLEETFLFRFQCTVSRMGTGPDSLPKANREVEEAGSYRKLLGGLPGEIVFYDGILRTTGLEHRESPALQEERQRQLQMALLQGSTEEGKRIFHEVVEDYFVCSRPAVQFVQLRLFEAIDLLLKAMEKAAYEMGRQSDLRELQAAPRLLSAENVWAMEETADKLIDEFVERAGANGLQARLPNRIRTYIRTHYQDPDLNVNRVADEFHVTPTYATRVFKQEFQCGILTYIQQVRVDEAKRLLGHTATVKEISEQVGFSNPAALLRCFKKLEGTTPAQFIESGTSYDAERKEA